MSAEYFPRWEADGFSGPPETCVAQGDEIVLRAYSRDIDPVLDVRSERIGRFFFVPACGVTSGPIQGFSIDDAGWTGGFLERRLNAFVFGNSYERIGIWALNPGVPYQIGGIGFDTRTTYQVAPWQEPVTIGGTTRSDRALFRHHRAPGDDPFYFRQVMLMPDLPAAMAALPPEDPQRRKAFVDAVRRLVRPVDDFAVALPLRPSATLH